MSSQTVSNAEIKKQLQMEVEQLNAILLQLNSRIAELTSQEIASVIAPAPVIAPVIAPFIDFIDVSSVPSIEDTEEEFNEDFAAASTAARTIVLKSVTKRKLFKKSGNLTTGVPDNKQLKNIAKLFDGLKHSKKSDDKSEKKEITIVVPVNVPSDNGDLNKLKIDELKNIAKSLKLTGISRMKKQELIEKITQKRNSANDVSNIPALEIDPVAHVNPDIELVSEPIVNIEPVVVPIVKPVKTMKIKDTKGDKGERSMQELKKIAKEYDIKGYTTMGREELEYAIKVPTVTFNAKKLTKYINDLKDQTLVIFASNGGLGFTMKENTKNIFFADRCNAKEKNFNPIHCERFFKHNDDIIELSKEFVNSLNNTLKECDTSVFISSVYSDDGVDWIIGNAMPKKLQE